jgi:hypothetical protein
MNGCHVNDNGGRRSGFERRQYDYSSYIPERRSGKDRRSGQDRRQKRIFLDEFFEDRRGNGRPCLSVPE